ncbi:MAG: methyltransferase domain-containing protein, partial [Actinomycetota bacterium]
MKDRPKEAARGADFYDDPGVFARYFEHRDPSDSVVTTMEAPAFWEVVGDVTGARVLDLGCGDGGLSAELLARGATLYEGIDASRAMVKRAIARHG